jgi:hypothetical protein
LSQGLPGRHDEERHVSGLELLGAWYEKDDLTTKFDALVNELYGLTEEEIRLVEKT